MAFNFKQIKYVDEQSMYTVYGYIHFHESTITDQSLFSNIPTSIKDIILCFYFDSSDKWDKNCVGDNIIMDKNILKTTGLCGGSAFLTNVIRKGKYEWTILIKNIYVFLYIGIWKINSGTPIINDTFWSKKNNAYVFNATGGALLDPKSIDREELGAFGKSCRKNVLLKWN